MKTPPLFVCGFCQAEFHAYDDFATHAQVTHGALFPTVRDRGIDSFGASVAARSGMDLDPTSRRKFKPLNWTDNAWRQ